MGTYTLPEGFTEFDMFAFGSALLVGGELIRERKFLPRGTACITSITPYSAKCLTEFCFV